MSTVTKATSLKDSYLSFNGGRGERDVLLQCLCTDLHLMVWIPMRFIASENSAMRYIKEGTLYQCFFCTKCAKQYGYVVFERLYKLQELFWVCGIKRKRQYCIFNEQYTKEEYEKKVKELSTGSYAIAAWRFRKRVTGSRSLNAA